jgi:small subunit ribosomal protein S18
MAQKKKPRAKGKDPKKGKPRKKKVSPIVKEGIEYVDYKDVNLLRAFMSDRAKIRARRVTGNDVQQQRAAANAIKVARSMALLRYASLVVTQRKGDMRRRDRDDRGDRPERGERPQDGEEARTDDAVADEVVVDADVAIEAAAPEEVGAE